MTESLSWYIASSLLGWLAFPLVYRLFPALADRGYTLARAVGLLLWAWLFWMLASLGVLRNDMGGLLFALLLLILISMWALFKGAQVQTDTQHALSRSIPAGSDTNYQLPITNLQTWFSSHKPLVLIAEILFLAAFAFLAFVRASNPEAVATEKPMELAFINAIIRSPTFPPNDPWMSGYSISYYYFGYVMAAMLANLTGVSGNVAFNLMLALVFALAAVGSYGVLYNLLCAYKSKQVDTESETPNPQPASPNPHLASPHNSSFTFHPSSLALLAPLFLLLLSNLEGFLEIIHGLGWLWPATQPSNLQPATFNFWDWLDIKDLVNPPSGEWIPTKFWWWWRASRVLSDYTLAGEFKEVIDEFPAFSFVLGDLHPHVMALPFNMLGIGVALNLFLDGWRGVMRFFDLRLHAAPRDLLFTALVLGGLAFLNTWDILPAAALIVGAYVLVRVRTEGWDWPRLEDAFTLGVPLVILAFLLYLPFYLGFSSQAGGLLPNLVNPTRGAHLWVMWGTLLLPLFAFLIYLTRGREPTPRYRTALLLTLGLILFLWLISWLIAFAAQRLKPDVANLFFVLQGQPDVPSLFRAATLRRLSYIGGLLTIASVLWLTLSHLLKVGKSQVEGQESDSHLSITNYQSPTTNIQPATFSLLLLLIGSLLILGPDFLYLHDGFGYRINTVFKFYYQAWQLWAIAAAFAAASLTATLRGVWNWAWRVALTFVLIAGLTYPVFAFASKTNNFKPSTGYSLDGSAHFDFENPEDAAAIRYLQAAPLGVLAEAVGNSYSLYARLSTHSGQPAVVGWLAHEFQWRGNWDAHGTREADIKTLYEAPDWETAQVIINRYQIRYIAVGNLERTTYNVNEAKFQNHLAVLFQAGNTVVYGVP